MQHYLQTSHTYALNIFDRKVWDFAGNGYVHRLILQQSSDSPEITNNGTESANVNLLEEDRSNTVQSSSFKFTEVSPPYNPHSNASYYRPINPPLSNQEEDLLVGSKMESMLNQYNEILAWRLQQSRDFYEAKIKSIWENAIQSQKGSLVGVKSISHAGSSSSANNLPAEQLNLLETVNSSKNSSGKDSLDWLQRVKNHLLNDTNKLQSKCVLLREKIAAARKEQENYIAMEHQLQSNMIEWERKVREAEQSLKTTEGRFHGDIIALEKKVQLLLNKLEDDNSDAPITAVDNATNATNATNTTNTTDATVCGSSRISGGEPRK